MRLGTQLCNLSVGSKVQQIYGVEQVSERHRHRYELNPVYISQLEEKGMRVAGYSAHQHLAEIIEPENHPWFIGTQFHPEFQSKPTAPHPLFIDFVRAALSHKKG